MKELRDDQFSVFNDDHKIRVVACGRRWGATNLGVASSLKEFSEGKSVHWITTNSRMAFDVWMRFDAILGPDVRRIKNDLTFKLGAATIQIDTGRAVSEEKYRAYSRVFLVIDPFNRVRIDLAKHALAEIKNETFGKLLAIGQPAKVGDFFWKMYGHGLDQNYPDWKSWQFSSEPHIDKDVVEQIRQAYPQKTYRQEILAEFIEEED